MSFGSYKAIFTARCYAERGYEIACRLSVCLSVRPSVTFRYRDHIGWNSSKIISRPNSLRPMRSLTPNMGDLVQLTYLWSKNNEARSYDPRCIRLCLIFVRYGTVGCTCIPNCLCFVLYVLLYTLHCTVMFTVVRKHVNIIIIIIIIIFGQLTGLLLIRSMQADLASC